MAEPLRSLVEQHRERIREILPDAEVSLSGSASVPSLPANDVDLVILVSDVREAAARLRPFYEPLYQDEWREDWVAFRQRGAVQVDVVVTYRGSRGDAHHRLAWLLIAADSRLLAEYQELKAAADDYEQRKAAFFERVVARLNAPH